METTFLQAYRNWLTIIDVIATADVAVGWYEPHSHMLCDDKFTAYFDAWCDMDKQLHMQFISHPFIVDPNSTTYLQLLEQAHMDSFFSQAEKSQQTFEKQWASRAYGSHSAWHESSGPTPHRYMHTKRTKEKLPIPFVRIRSPSYAYTVDTLCRQLHIQSIKSL